MSPLQKKMMRELLKHIDELNVHVKNLDEDIDNHMSDDEKKAIQAITDVIDRLSNAGTREQLITYIAGGVKID